MPVSGLSVYRYVPLLRVWFFNLLWVGYRIREVGSRKGCHFSKNSVVNGLKILL